MDIEASICEVNASPSLWSLRTVMLYGVAVLGHRESTLVVALVMGKRVIVDVHNQCLKRKEVVVANSHVKHQ